MYMYNLDWLNINTGIFQKSNNFYAIPGLHFFKNVKVAAKLVFGTL